MMELARILKLVETVQYHPDQMPARDASHNAKSPSVAPEIPSKDSPSLFLPQLSQQPRKTAQRIIHQPPATSTRQPGDLSRLAGGKRFDSDE